MFNKNDLKTIKFLINFYIMNTNYKDIDKNIKTLEGKVVKELENASNN